MSKVLVTGGAGFIGSHLVKALLKQGRKTIVANDFSKHGIDHLTNLGVSQSDIEIRDTDLTEYKQALEATEDAETVFHLAARVGSLSFLHGNETAELSALQQNLLIDANIFRACLVKGVRKLIYASSRAVYPMYRQYSEDAIFTESDLDVGNPEYLFCHKPKAGDVRRFTQIAPDGGYGWSKFMGEIQLSWMKNVRIGIARIFNAYGVNEPVGDNSHVVADLIQKVISCSDNNITILGDGKQTRDLIYVEDCAEALSQFENCLSNTATKNPVVLNIGSSVATPIGVLGEMIAKIRGAAIEIQFDPSKPAGPRGRTADIRKANITMGWQPRISLENRSSKDI